MIVLVELEDGLFLFVFDWSLLLVFNVFLLVFGEWFGGCFEEKVFIFLYEGWILFVWECVFWFWCLCIGEEEFVGIGEYEYLFDEWFDDFDMVVYIGFFWILGFLFIVFNGVNWFCCCVVCDVIKFDVLCGLEMFLLFLFFFGVLSFVLYVFLVCFSFLIWFFW